MERIKNNTTQYGKTNEVREQKARYKHTKSALVVTLKKQVKELKEELAIQFEELETMKRNTKFTKFQELEVKI